MYSVVRCRCETVINAPRDLGCNARLGNLDVTHILDKLGATNRTEATARARELGVLP